MYLPVAILLLLGDATSILAEHPSISIDASKEIHRVSRLLTGACIEDVNHEIYGGIYSQLIFGESFQEPSSQSPIENFRVVDGEWELSGETLRISGGMGSKLIADREETDSIDVAVDIKFDNQSSGNAGMITRVSQAKAGADNFFGYEISLNPAKQVMTIGRHRNSWEHIRDVPCKVNIGQWNRLRATLNEKTINVFVDGTQVLSYVDDNNGGLERGQIGLRQWERQSTFKNLEFTVDSRRESLPFKASASNRPNDVSHMWQAFREGTAQSEYLLDRGEPFVGNQSQEIRFHGGEGCIGIENRGLNRWGIHFEASKPYEGVLYARSASPCELWVCAESGDGSTLLAEKKLAIDSSKWKRFEFQLSPQLDAADGRFSLKLKSKGSVDVGYVSLEPGPWGRYENLPLRRDVAEGIVDQGVTILRYGGSMVNNDRYRWKKMIGPRAERSPYVGHWYAHSTNGWGIFDFMNYCEAANFEYVPTFSMSETPQEMAEFVRYAKESADSEWGQKRHRDGRLASYKLKYMQLGNEERVDEDYADRFIARAKMIWEVDPSIILIVGDFVYDHPITDPSSLSGAASGITNLNGHKKILEFGKQSDHEIWFDVHVWTGGPRPNSSFDSMFTFIDQLEKLVEGARVKVLTFEFNSNNHDQRRAIANALAINAIERDGRLPIACSANCLQPDGQNDNCWDQGLLFLSPSKTWLQPPGYVTQMYSRNYCPRLVACEVSDNTNDLDCNAKLSEDGKTLVLNIVNVSQTSKHTQLAIVGFQTTREEAEIVSLSAESLDAVNTASDPQHIAPKTGSWKHKFAKGNEDFTFPPNSVTTIVLK